MENFEVFLMNDDDDAKINKKQHVLHTYNDNPMSLMGVNGKILCKYC